MSSATGFPLQELHGVVDDPPAGGVLQVVEPGVGAGPVDHAARGIEMADAGAALQGRQCGAARVSEQVEHLQRPRGSSARVAQPDPWRRLLGEDAQVAEIGQGEPKAYPCDSCVPGLGHAIPPAPVQAPVAIKRGHGLCPAPGMARRPDRVSGRADKTV